VRSQRFDRSLFGFAARMENVMLKSVCLFIAALGLSGCNRIHVDEPAVAAETVVVAAPPSINSDGATTQAELQRPVAAIERAVIISIDGLRPDLALRASMPRLRGLCERGCFTFWAETVKEAYTLPAHVSMLTGCSVERHGVSWNDYIEEAYPNVPTLFERAKQAGYSTALVTGKMKFITLTKPGTLDWSFLPKEEPMRDEEVAAEAERMLREHRPQVMFIHFGNVDTVGHEHGWGTPAQIAAIEQADQAVGHVLNVLAQLQLLDSTAIFVTADHGGSGKDHGEKDPRSRLIPWIVAAPGLKHDFDLTLAGDRQIRIEDTCATTCWLLAIGGGQICEGRPVTEIVAGIK
jgi:hypothetical protein